MERRYVARNGGPQTDQAEVDAKRVADDIHAAVEALRSELPRAFPGGRWDQPRRDASGSNLPDAA